MISEKEQNYFENMLNEKDRTIGQLRAQISQLEHEVG